MLTITKLLHSKYSIQLRLILYLRRIKCICNCVDCIGEQRVFSVQIVLVKCQPVIAIIFLNYYTITYTCRLSAVNCAMYSRGMDLKDFTFLAFYLDSTEDCIVNLAFVSVYSIALVNVVCVLMCFLLIPCTLCQFRDFRKGLLVIINI